MNIFI
jgi:predicted metalloendopeptidase